MQWSHPPEEAFPTRFSWRKIRARNFCQLLHGERTGPMEKTRVTGARILPRLFGKAAHLRHY
ncbi:hypothetical protein AA106555_0081 [Neokomagataea thailandica NBRC 106555]|uniref:Transposase n=1 Tax=Neokomagataea thailandica NBRC 106555 TaxID=1223520 RepID=A0ABQ0QM28_9PROT|nr:hypothetical protein AA106555_0081 [Neokomagataea thailandica NBRC 106555]